MRSFLFPLLLALFRRLLSVPRQRPPGAQRLRQSCRALCPPAPRSKKNESKPRCARPPALSTRAERLSQGSFSSPPATRLTANILTTFWSNLPSPSETSPCQPATMSLDGNVGTRTSSSSSTTPRPGTNVAQPLLIASRPARALNLFASGPLPATRLFKLADLPSLTPWTTRTSKLADNTQLRLVAKCLPHFKSFGCRRKYLFS